jgi:hypothetical protein
MWCSCCRLGGAASGADATSNKHPHHTFHPRFVVSLFLEDDTLSVFEPRRTNSGLPGGAFAERGRVRRPGGGASDCYGPQDMKVGARAGIGCAGTRSPMT